MVPPVPAAAEETAVIVPVLGRPGSAAPFMESLAASGAPLARVYAVADLDDADTAKAWDEAGAAVLTLDRLRPPGDVRGEGQRSATGTPRAVAAADRGRRAVPPRVAGPGPGSGPRRRRRGRHQRPAQPAGHRRGPLAAPADPPLLHRRAGRILGRPEDRRPRGIPALVRRRRDSPRGEAARHVGDGDPREGGAPAPAVGPGRRRRTYALGREHTEADKALFEAGWPASGSGA